MTTIRYRHLGENDLELLLSADTEVFDHAIRPDQARAFLADPMHEMVLALDGARVVGMASGVVMLHPDKAPQLFVHELGVAEDRQRRGIGRALLRRLLIIGRDRGCTVAWVGTETDNTPARGLYEAERGRGPEHFVMYDWEDLAGLSVEDDDIPPGSA